MPLPPLIGHEGVKTRLAGAHASGKLPQALLLAGPRGVGKQRLALWLAQLIQCEAPGQEPCGQCRPCHLVLSLQHPDVHWFVPADLSKRAGSGCGEAELLIPQVGTEVAANALLKALEEPPADSVIIITAADANALLPTILSRVVLVRMARIADSAVTAFAQQTLGIGDKAELAQRVTAAEGCIGKLFATVTPRSGQSGAEQAARFVDAPLLFALGQVPFQARGAFTDMLDALANKLRSEAKRGGDTDKLVEAIALVLDARDLAQGNVNPQLLAAVLAEDLQATRRS